MKTVLVTAIGSFSSAAVISGLKKAGYRVIGTDIYPAAWLSESASVDRFFQIPRCDAGASYPEALKKIIREEGVSFLIPLTDAEIDVLNGIRETLLPAVLCISAEEVIRLLRNKAVCAEAVQKSLRRHKREESVKTIPTRRASEVDFDTLHYPVVLKPSDGRSSEGLFRIKNEDQLGFALAGLSRTGTGLSGEIPDSYLLQPMLEGRVVCCDLVRDKAGNCAVIPREELLRTLNGAGLSVRVFRDPELETVCRELAADLGIAGAVNMEFIRDEKRKLYWFLECNPRFSGGAAFTEKAGYPLVENAMRAYEGKEIEAASGITEGFLVKKYVEVSTGL